MSAMLQTEGSNILQYSPFNSSVDPSFWHQLSHVKLDIDRLEESARPIWGYYSNAVPPGLTSNLHVDCSAYNEECEVQKPLLGAYGILLNKNTLETFKNCNKIALLEEHGQELWHSITSGEALNNPALLSRFFLLTYADLKKYHFYYWSAFPAPSFPIITLKKQPLRLVDTFSEKQVTELARVYLAVDDWRQRGYFLVKVGSDGDSSSINIVPLCDIKKVPVAIPDGEDIKKTEGVYVGVADPCPLPDHPGWPLRNLLALLSYCCSELVGLRLRVLCLRLRLLPCSTWSTKDSLVLEVTLPPISTTEPSSPETTFSPHSESEALNSPTEMPSLVNNTSHSPGSKVRWVGWERNERGKFGPRVMNLSSSMDPVRLAETSVDLNLKLMKWRLMPELDLDLIKNTRCLLLGSGTLGCSVARTLLGWGVRYITLVDNGCVSYSNPVRQSLFTYKDSLNSGRPKSEAAADALKAIFPGVESCGVQLNIPMPGHPIGPSLLADTRTNTQVLEELIGSHDVVFLLMDSRESRWLPTLIAASKRKLVMNAALGFDTYLVMRHGVKSDDAVNSIPDCSGKSIPGHKLGCYFCNDVTAPGNSQRDRTLDQQCTVTRPGISAVAGALAVELMVSLLQHPLRGYAPASCVEECHSEGGEEGSPLGLVPHSVRGFLAKFQQVSLASHVFSQCIACSDKVLYEYETRGFDFLLQAFNTPDYLEDITGLTQLHKEMEDAQIWELSDSESCDLE
ncbi:Ubiquitin-like modifier-activating enzyme ATG7 [Cryptotermes secundus]|uniref:Ubiquitin-like modifier-activating enzyme ATG7 n=2 Tax=Cryptotermes secundus TaxID=105785 RepID=A0A2J7QCD3_9NEOP|nr:ubiquitin-like modifier-activating enzyme ATG7 isoform X1 [Cryptotermes secundus]PNF26232.1 Ubiquitin-like modifier-activating enzyme ATG7 [Cryptotermes secundus]PNF26233.1 Ubiquitin-like modifier-activating enzyme ATG7 [Cryptotermes secundus]